MTQTPVGNRERVCAPPHTHTHPSSHRQARQPRLRLLRQPLADRHRPHALQRPLPGLQQRVGGGEAACCAAPRRGPCMEEPQEVCAACFLPCDCSLQVAWETTLHLHTLTLSRHPPAAASQAYSLGAASLHFEIKVGLGTTLAATAATSDSGLGTSQTMVETLTVGWIGPGRTHASACGKGRRALLRPAPPWRAPALAQHAVQPPHSLPYVHLPAHSCPPWRPSRRAPTTCCWPSCWGTSPDTRSCPCSGATAAPPAPTGRERLHGRQTSHKLGFKAARPLLPIRNWPLLTRVTPFGPSRSPPRRAQRAAAAHPGHRG